MRLIAAASTRGARRGRALAGADAGFAVEELDVNAKV
jgi:hypothetical protein